MEISLYTDLFFIISHNLDKYCCLTNTWHLQFNIMHIGNRKRFSLQQKPLGPPSLHHYHHKSDHHFNGLMA